MFRGKTFIDKSWSSHTCLAIIHIWQYYDYYCGKYNVHSDNIGLLLSVHKSTISNNIANIIVEKANGIVVK